MDFGHKWVSELFLNGTSAQYRLYCQVCYRYRVIPVFSSIQKRSKKSSLDSTTLQESRAIAKKTARCALYMDALKNFGSPGYAHGYFSRNCYWAFVVIDRMKVRAKYEVRSFTRSWDIMILGSPWIRPRSLFCNIFNGLLNALTQRIYRPNLTSVALSVPEIIRGTLKLGSPWIRPGSLLPKIFNGRLFRWTLWKYRPNLKSVALPVPEIIART